MTTEPAAEPVPAEPQAEYVELTAFPEAGYVQFGIPGVPFSAVRIPLVYNSAEMTVLIAHAIEAAKGLIEAFNDEFPQGFQHYAVGADGRAAPSDAPQREASQRTQQPVRTAPPRQVRAGGGTGWFCPDHNVEVIVSSPQYQTYDMDEDGNEIPAKYYHPLAEHETYRGADGRQVRNHTLYRSQLVRSVG